MDKFLPFLLDELVKPLCQRLGTIVGTTLGTVGMSVEGAQAVDVALCYVCGFLLDLAVTKFRAR